jgi:hypothetical protein
MALSLRRQEKTTTRPLRKKRFTRVLDTGYLIKELQ